MRLTTVLRWLVYGTLTRQARPPARFATRCIHGGHQEGGHGPGQPPGLACGSGGTNKRGDRFRIASSPRISHCIAGSSSDARTTTWVMIGP
jgi:hypothetical protein